MISLVRKRGPATTQWWTIAALVGLGGLAGAWLRFTLPERSASAAVGLGILITLSLVMGWSNATSI